MSGKLGIVCHILVDRVSFSERVRLHEVTGSEGERRGSDRIVYLLPGPVGGGIGSQKGPVSTVCDRMQTARGPHSFRLGKVNTKNQTEQVRASS